MSLAPSVAVPRAGFNPLPLYIGLFCLLWSFAFVAGKIGVTDCPPLILLDGAVFAGRHPDPRHHRRCAARRGHRSPGATPAIFAMLGVANNALYLGLGYTGLQTVSAGLGGLIVSANPVFTAVLAAAVPRRGADLAQGDGAVARHRRRRLHRLASHVGRHGQPGTASCSRWRHWPRSWPAPSCSRCWRRRAASGSATACRISPAGIVLLPFAFTLARCQRHRAERAAAGRVRLPRARRLDPRLSALVSSPESVWRDRRERLSLPDAAARHAVRLPRARRACRVPRPARDRSGRARHLSGDPSRRIGVAKRSKS